jgi:hypothetical protein
MASPSTDYLTQLDNLLASARQAWLFGAGISIGANIPLMGPLTSRVFSILAGKPAESLLVAVKGELPATAHIEHILSQIGDYAAIAERSSREIAIGTAKFSLTELTAHHDAILVAIADTVRWGYTAASGGASEKIGTHDLPLVKIENHAQYVKSLLGKSQAGISERRYPVKFFTTNYDTLIEDALSLECYTYWDGFSGGAVAFRSYRYGDAESNEPVRAHVVKLHGSIDWHLSSDGKVWRVRDRDLYPTRSGRVLIYPQSTKYLATQRDPFAAQFDLFRRSLSHRGENILAICGYSFGDEHINQEIEIAMQHPENKTTVLAFSPSVGDTLKKWQNSAWQRRLYVITESGLFVGSEGPFHEPPPGKKHDWWTFEGVTNILNNGAEACVI